MASTSAARLAGYSSLLAEAGGRQQSEGPADEIPLFSGELIEIGGSRIGRVNTPGDADGYLIDLVAGQSYAFTLTGAGLSPLEDPYLELYFNGLRVAIDDDAGPGRDALMRFTASISGAYYIVARAWEPVEGPTLTGEYTLAAALGPSQNPLDALDLGFVAPTTNISVYFATAGQTHDGTPAQRSWSPYEIDAAMSAMATFSAVTTLNFSQAVSAAGATFILMLSDLPENVLGEFGTVNGTGYGVFDPDPAIWSEALLQPGGLAFSTLIHEIGHGLGLAHPHDNGGIDPDDSSEILQGVVSDFGSYGTFGFNQGAFTIMSYNRGAPALPFSANDVVTFGSEATPGPLDIALLQLKYGVNTSTNAGDDVYVLTEGNGPGTRYRAIWDVAGTDSIVYTGASGVSIDLRAATLLNAPGGAGGVSYISGTYGGFTVANGVIIEIATGGSGNDKLWGGAGDNTLASGAGDDTLSGGEGFDTLNGGIGDDRVLFEDNPAGVNVNLLLQTATDGWGTTDTLFSIEFVTGSAFDDYIVSGLGNSVGQASVFGGSGNDYIEGHAAGWDSLYGGDGDDTIVMLGAGQAGIMGEEGNDIIVGGSLDDIALNGGAGDDDIRGGSGADLIYGGQGQDTLYGDSGDDGIDGNEGVDILVGGAGNDVLDGGDGDDTLNAGAGSDLLFGGIGSDFIDGGLGNDTLSYERDTYEGVNVSLAISGPQNVVRSDFDTLLDVENLTGSGGADSLTGNDSANILRGEDGADTLRGGGGDDTLFGGWGDDYILGGAGNDLMAGNIAIEFVVAELLERNDTFDGGDGIDTVSYQSSDQAVVVNLAIATAQDTQGAGMDTFLNVENLVGSQFGDTLTGDANTNMLSGGAGADTLDGGGGNDTLIGQEGADALLGGEGFDTADYSTSSAGLEILLWSGAAAGGDADGDTLASIENLIGGAAADILHGSDGVANWLAGGAGDDQLAGMSGDDILAGGAGSDTIDGGEGGDTSDYSASSAPISVNLLDSAATGGHALGDTLISIENLLGSAFNDTLTGDAGNNVLVGGAGVDTLIGGLGDDTLVGGDNTDFIVDTSGVVSIDGGSGNEQITLGAAVVSGTVDGGTGTDQLTKGGSIAGLTLTSIEILNTNGGTVTGTAAQFEGFDTIRFSAGQPFTAVSLALSAEGTVDLADELLGRRALFAGTAGNDTITTSNGSDQIDGGAGDDVLVGNAGNDTLIGGLGDDVLSGGEGTDFLVELSGVVSVDGGAGDDVITLGAALNVGTVTGGLGTDQLNKGGTIAGLTISGIEIVNTNGGTLTATAAQLEGFDTIRFSAAQATTAVSLALSEAGTVDLVDELLGRRALFAGSSGNDVITTSNGSDQIDGGAGDDVLTGNAGVDTLIGGLGDDSLSGGDGGDFIVDLAGIVAIDAGDGDDTLTVGALVTSGTIAGGLGTDQLNKSGNLSAITVSGIETVNTNGGTLTATAAQLEGFETIRFSAAQATAAISLVQSGAGTVDLTDELLGRRVIYQGSSGNDVVTTSNGADRLDGGSGDDTLNGGLGNDTVLGGIGTDLIVQGAADGRDIIDGGAGVDTYRLLGTAEAETFRIMTRAEAVLAGITGLAGATEIVITRNGTDNASVIAELDNIEEIEIDSLVATANNGNGVVDGGASGGDTIIVTGNFATTSLDYSTITINGSTGNDTIDITGLTSDHRVVFASNGGDDSVIGQPRAQDVFGLGAFGMSDGIDAMVGMRGDMREVAIAAPRGESAGRTMIETDDLFPLDVVDAGPVAAADTATPILSDTIIDHRSVLTDYPIA